MLKHLQNPRFVDWLKREHNIDPRPPQPHFQEGFGWSYLKFSDIRTISEKVYETDLILYRCKDLGDVVGFKIPDTNWTRSTYNRSKIPQSLTLENLLKVLSIEPPKDIPENILHLKVPRRLETLPENREFFKEIEAFYDLWLLPEEQT